jgi:hypothetical protein
MKRAFMCPSCKQVIRDTYTEQLEEQIARVNLQLAVELRRRLPVADQKET